MSQLPRIAVGTIQPEADSTAMLWALMDCLERTGLQVQSFLSHAYFTPREAATAITGLSPRHLDSWIMNEDLCREIFTRGSNARDLALLEGCFRSSACGPCAGSDLNTLCRWLDLPRLAVVDVRALDDCRLPVCPPGIDGLLLDRVRDVAELVRVQTLLESLWKVPVLGWLGLVSELRSRIAAMRSGTRPALELCHALGDQFAARAHVERIYSLASQRPFPQPPTKPSACAKQDACPARRQRPLRIAVAYDQAFRGYFPDTLELLELRGAEVSEFSPLRDERLPPETDIVYFGCGHPERFLPELAENECMILALKSHVCGGRRLYAECGGLAYLCQQIETPDGERWPMAGVLPAKACYHETNAPPTPVEVTLSGDTWLGPAGMSCRGYLNPRWTVSGLGQAENCGQWLGSEHELHLIKRHQALGSRAYLNFAAQPPLLDSFFRPHRAPSDAAWAGASPPS